MKHNTRQFKNNDSIIDLYNATVKSKLIYGSVIWNMNILTDEYEIEKIQNQFLRYMSFKINRPMSKHDYSYLYNIFNIHSLTLSKKHSD